MKKGKGILTIVVLGVVCVLYSCQSTGVKTRDSYKLTDHKDKPVEVVQLDCSKDTVLKFRSGSTLEISENSFIKKNGSVPVGGVEIKFSEYHTFGEIYASGNPMLFKEDDGRLGQMLSGGMIDFNAFDSNGDELLLRDDKPVNVGLACQSGGSNFDLFYIKEQNINFDQGGFLQIGLAPQNPIQSKIRWERVEKVTLHKRKSLDGELAAIIEPNQPIVPQKNDTSKVFFNINMNFEQFPEFKGFSSLIFTFINPSDESILNKKWKSIDLQDSGLGYFDMVLSSNKSTVSVPVVPMLDGEDFSKALADFNRNKTEYKIKLDKINRQKQAKLNAGAYLASFVANRTGTFNIDAIYHQVESLQAFQPEFVWNDNAIDVKEVLLISSFDGAKSVVNYNASNLGEFFYIPMLQNSLMVTDQSGNTYSINATNFKKEAKKFGIDHTKLELKKASVSAYSLEEKTAYMYSLDNSVM